MTTQEQTSVGEPAVVVNGPEDDILDWYAIDWRTVEDDVRRLRQRIFTASQAGDIKRVRNLQALRSSPWVLVGPLSVGARRSPIGSGLSEGPEPVNRYHSVGVHAAVTEPGSPVLIRYADDLVALCHTRHEAEQVKARLAGWLTPRGLTFNEDKTRIVTLDDGFDFLGFTVRRQSGKLLIKPSKAALRRIRERLRTEMHALRGANATMVIIRLNPIIRGWAAYYRTVVSSEAFNALDIHLWRLTYKWATHGHANKSKHWIINRYFGAFNKSRRDRWVFGDRDSGAYLAKFAWTGIVRHRMVKGGSSPDDPDLAHYWADRRRRGAPPPMDQLSLRL